MDGSGKISGLVSPLHKRCTVFKNDKVGAILKPIKAGLIYTHVATPTQMKERERLSSFEGDIATLV